MKHLALLCYSFLTRDPHRTPWSHGYDSQSVGIQSFDELLDKHGNGDGCEVCKPLVSNILASINNDMIFENDGMTLQDTNDRALANMQRGVDPRVG